jgi:mRNA interferase RelE/StbE
VYRLEVSPAADRELGRLKERIHRQDFERLRTAIGGLAGEPRPHGVMKIKGAEMAYRIRAGNYRIVYEVYDSEKLVLILHVGRRTETTYHTLD